MCETPKDGTCWLVGGEISSMGTTSDFQIWLSTKMPLIEDPMANISHAARDWIRYRKIKSHKMDVSRGPIWKQRRKKIIKCFISQCNSSTIYRHEEGKRTTKSHIFLVYVFHPEVN